MICMSIICICSLRTPRYDENYCLNIFCSLISLTAVFRAAGAASGAAATVATVWYAVFETELRALPRGDGFTVEEMPLGLFIRFGSRGEFATLPFAVFAT